MAKSEDMQTGKENLIDSPGSSRVSGENRIRMTIRFPELCKNRIWRIIVSILILYHRELFL
jgi:hypothetical protein